MFKNIPITNPTDQTIGDQRKKFIKQSRPYLYLSILFIIINEMLTGRKKVKIIGRQIVKKKYTKIFKYFLAQSRRGSYSN
jgi:hypothetical protein